MSDESFDNLLQLLMSENEDDRNLALEMGKMYKGWTLNQRGKIYILKAWVEGVTRDRFYDYLINNTLIWEFTQIFDDSVSNKEAAALRRCAKKILKHH